MRTRLLPIALNTGLVTYTINVNGNPLPNHIPVFSIEVLYEINRIPSAVISLADGNASTGEWTLSSETYFIPGNEIVIFAGYHSENEPVFSGIVVGQTIRVRSGRLELKVLCKDRSVAMTTTRKSRHFKDMTDSNAVAVILQEYDIASDHVTPTDITHAGLVQYDTSDWDFIIMRMEANGMVCLADDEGLHTFDPTVESSPVVTLQFGANVLEFDANIDARRQFRSVISKAWSPSDQSEATGESNEPDWTTTGNLDPAEIGATVGVGTEELRHSGALNQSELEKQADGVLLRSRMAFLRGRVRVQGLSAAGPGDIVELAGFGERFNGPVLVGAVRHEIGHGNWLTDMELGLTEEMHSQRFNSSALPAGGFLAAIAGLHTGIVTALEGDPAGESRVRVRISAIDSSDEGMWARVATLDAGDSRGTIFQPEINDEVIVGFLNDDPRYPVILGMLHSSMHPPPEDASDENHIKGYHSRSGLRILFDDENQSVTIDTPGGHEILANDDTGMIKLKDSNGNKIEMSSSGITITSAGKLSLKASGDVVVESGINVELKAGAEWKAVGGAGAEINSAAITTIKGALVQIN